MLMIGEGARAKKIVDVVCVIDRAHRKAGFHISKVALKEVQAANVDRNWTTRHIRVHAPEEEGGNITAFRMRTIAPDIHRSGKPNRARVKRYVR